MIVRDYVTLQVTQLHKAAWNYKDDDDLVKDKLKEAIKRNGQLVNIIVRESESTDGCFEIVNGNHRLDAFTELGITECIAVNLGKISQAEAIRIGIETNELEFAVNDARLAAALKEIASSVDMTELLKTMPYDQATIEQYLMLADGTTPSFQSVEDLEQKGSDSSARLTLTFKLDAEDAEAWENWKDVAAEKLESKTDLDAFRIAVITAMREYATGNGAAIGEDEI